MEKLADAHEHSTDSVIYVEGRTIFQFVRHVDQRKCLNTTSRREDHRVDRFTGMSGSSLPINKSY